MKKIKENFGIILSTIITIIIFVMFKNEHFALDTYGFELDINGNANWYLQNGRVIMMFFLKISRLLKISYKNIKLISLIISLISLFISNIILNKNLKKYEEKYSFLISTCIIYSPFIFEFYLFPEYTGIMSLSILASVLAYEFITKYFDTNQIKFLILSFVFALIGTCSYQGGIGCFVALSALYIVKNYKNIKEFIKQNIYVISIYGIASLVSLIITKICGLQRLASEGYNIIKTIKNVIMGTIRLLINTSFVFPKYYFALILLLITLLIIFYLIKKGDKKKIILTMYLIVTVILFSVAPQFLVKYDSVWIVPRSNIAMGMLFGILCLNYLSINKENDKYSKITVAIIALTLVLQFIGWHNIRNDHYFINEANKLETEVILNEIKTYEILNKKEIKNIALAGDESISYTFEGIDTTSGDVNVRAYVFEWSTKDILNYYSKKDYKIIKPTKKIKEYCSKNNWDKLELEQLIFEEDTLYMCIY